MTLHLRPRSLRSDETDNHVRMKVFMFPTIVTCRSISFIYSDHVSVRTGLSSESLSLKSLLPCFCQEQQMKPLVGSLVGSPVFSGSFNIPEFLFPNSRAESRSDWFLLVPVDA